MDKRFWTGILWLCYEVSGEKHYREVAEQNVKSFIYRIENEIEVEHHDLGFLYSLSCVSAYKLTGNEAAKNAAISAAEKLLQRYQSKENLSKLGENWAIKITIV